MKTTMLQLSEMVGKLVRTPDQDNSATSINIPAPNTTTQATTQHGQNNSPRWTKSANPTVIKPTKKTNTANITSTTTNTGQEETTKSKANPQRLILQFNPPIKESERINVDLARNEMNNILKALDVPVYFRIMAINWSRNGNPVLTTTSSGRAEDILGYADKLGKVLSENTLISALPDTEVFHAKINLIGTKDYQGNIRNNMDIHNELMEYITGYNKLRHACPPHWLGNQEYLEAKSQSSMVFSFATAEERDKFLGFGPIWLFNQRCTVTVYEDRPHVFSCRNCGSFAHKSCNSPACLKCGNKEHTTEEHPEDAPLRCINCHKEHAANYTNCNRRRRLLGLNPLPTASDSNPRNKKSPKKPAKMTGPAPNSSNNTIGLNGNQLIEVVTNKDSNTPLSLCVSSALHKITQAKVNRSSQRLREKALGKQKESTPNTGSGMEGVESTPSPSK